MNVRSVHNATQDEKPVQQAQVALQGEKLVQQCGYAAALRGNMAIHKMFVHKLGTENENVNNVLISKLPHT